ncbi:phospholipase D family protein [Candidatus Pacearchaeota archaeon]|nr:phospholipase D family protein [Candidatus Pacearchaeota archaeon]
MKTFSKNDAIYIGKYAGDEIIKEIKSAKSSVKIVSPYLSGNYVKELIHLHKKGRKITLITSDNIAENKKYSDFSASDLVIKNETIDLTLEKKRKNGITYSIILLIISLFTLINSVIFSIFFNPSIIILFFSIISLIYYHALEIKRTEYTPIFRIKVFDSKSGEKPWSTELIHSKIYVIDNALAFLGSVNFTYSGFKTHYETMIKIQDIKAVLDISQEVEELYNSKDLRAKEIEEWI